MTQSIDLMIKKASSVIKHAYAPFSNYHVAACINTDDDQFFTGVNVENASFGLTLCAETSAIASMIAAGSNGIKSIVIMASDNALCTPCGACRQRLYEFSNPQTLVHLCNQTSLIKTVTLDELLPLAFKFKP